MSREVQKERVLAGGGDLGAFMRSMAWERTALGAVEDWPPALRTLVGAMLGSPQPTCLFWGPDFTVICIDPGWVKASAYRSSFTTSVACI